LVGILVLASFLNESVIAEQAAVTAEETAVTTLCFMHVYS
jgi:hypothetical protein